MTDEEKAFQAVINTIDPKVEAHRGVIASALVRSIPTTMKLVKIDDNLKACPYCKARYMESYVDYWNYCGNCGQRLK